MTETSVLQLLKVSAIGQTIQLQKTGLDEYTYTVLPDQAGVRIVSGSGAMVQGDRRIIFV